MKLTLLKPILISFLIAIVSGILHMLVISLLLPRDFQSNFVYSTPMLYVIFYIFSALILYILIKINQKNINNVGFTFLLITSIKMAISYFLLKPILNSTSIYANSEKINFFVIFVLFLMIETIMTIRILNNKQ